MTHTKIAGIVVRALLQGLVLEAHDVSASGIDGCDVGHVLDFKWQTTRTDDLLETARLFVVLVGNREAIRACRRANFRGTREAELDIGHLPRVEGESHPIEGDSE